MNKCQESQLNIAGDIYEVTYQGDRRHINLINNEAIISINVSHYSKNFACA